MTSPVVRVLDVTVGHAGQREPALAGVSFEVRPGETVAIIGPSGVGKSTLLAALAGLTRPRAGSIVTRHGRLVGPTPRHALVFQDGALFPWLTLEQNILYGLRLHKMSAQDRTMRAHDLLARVRLTGHGHKYPHALSGGMRKRGAFARALATNPELLLLDEPFSAVDTATRLELHDCLRAARGIAVVLVTHDTTEAAGLADRALLLGGSPATIAAEVDLRSQADAGVRLARAVARIAPLTREEDRDEARAADGARSYPLGARVVGAR